MRRLVYLDEARDDLRAIAIYIATASQNRKIASHFVQKIREKCQQLSELPGTHGSHRSDLRSKIRSTPFGNYLILFRYTADTLEIVNILHASRDVTTYYDEG